MRCRAECCEWRERTGPLLLCLRAARGRGPVRPKGPLPKALADGTGTTPSRLPNAEQQQPQPCAVQRSNSAGGFSAPLTSAPARRLRTQSPPSLHSPRASALHHTHVKLQVTPHAAHQEMILEHGTGDLSVARREGRPRHVTSHQRRIAYSTKARQQLVAAVGKPENSLRCSTPSPSVSAG